MTQGCWQNPQPSEKLMQCVCLQYRGAESTVCDEQIVVGQ